MARSFTLGATTRPCNMVPADQAFEHIAATGYRHIALFRHQKTAVVSWDTPRKEVERVRQAAEDAGLTISMLLGNLPLDRGAAAAVDAYRRLLDNAAVLGVEWVLDCGCSEQHQAEYIRCMQQAAEHAETLGVRITLKPHGGIGMTGTGLLQVVQAVGHPAFTLCYDPGNIIYYSAGRLRPETDVTSIAEHVATFIVKDCIIREDGRPDVLVTPGDGLVDFPSVLRTILAAGFSGPLYVECVGSGTFQDIDLDLAFTRGYIRGILETADAESS